VWGLDRGYCQMIGGEKRSCEASRSNFQDASAGRGSLDRTPGREKATGTAEEDTYTAVQTALAIL